MHFFFRGRDHLISPLIDILLLSIESVIFPLKSMAVNEHGEDSWTSPHRQVSWGKMAGTLVIKTIGFFWGFFQGLVLSGDGRTGQGARMGDGRWMNLRDSIDSIIRGYPYHMTESGSTWITMDDIILWIIQYHLLISVTNMGYYEIPMGYMIL